jgi:hypothetical protein
MACVYPVVDLTGDITEAAAIEYAREYMKTLLKGRSLSLFLAAEKN